MTLRRLKPDDLKAFRALRLAALRHEPAKFGTSASREASEADAFFALRINQSRVFGVFDSGALIGTAAYSVSSDPKRAHKGRVWGLYVEDRARGQGHGLALMRRLIQTARREGLVTLILSVTGADPVPMRLYRGLGFEVYGTEPRSILVEGKAYDEVMMRLEL